MYKNYFKVNRVNYIFIGVCFVDVLYHFIVYL